MAPSSNRFRRLASQASNVSSNLAGVTNEGKIVWSRVGLSKLDSGLILTFICSSDGIGIRA